MRDPQPLANEFASTTTLRTRNGAKDTDENRIQAIRAQFDYLIADHEMTIAR